MSPRMLVGFDAVLKRTAEPIFVLPLGQGEVDISFASACWRPASQNRVSDQFDFNGVEELLSQQRDPQTKRPFRIGSNTLRKLAS